MKIAIYFSTVVEEVLRYLDSWSYVSNNMTTNGSTNILAAPCDPPKNMVANNITSTSVTVQWSYHGNCPKPGFIQGYRLTYQMHGIVPSPSASLRVSGENKTRAILNGLRPYSTYRIQLQVYTATGREGKPSTALVKTKEGGENVNIGGHEMSIKVVISVIITHAKLPQNTFPGSSLVA